MFLATQVLVLPVVLVFSVCFIFNLLKKFFFWIFLFVLNCFDIVCAKQFFIFFIMKIWVIMEIVNIVDVVIIVYLIVEFMVEYWLSFKLFKLLLCETE